MKINISDMNITFGASEKAKEACRKRINSSIQFRLAQGFNLLTNPCIWHQMNNVNQGSKALNQVRPKFTLIHVDILVIESQCTAAAD